MMIDFPNTYYQDLDRFAGLIWGNSQAVLRRHQPGDIEFVDLGGFLEAFQFLFAGIRHDRVLVRDEYRIALRTLQRDYDFGAYVLGQPGIGKTLFLIYALVQILGQKQVVVLHTRPEFYLCFRETVNVCSMTDTRPVCELPTVWALCDSNQSVQVPPDIFLYKPGRIRVIQTASPEASRWMRWSKQLGAECYAMDIWSDQEIADLAALFGLDAERTTTLAQKWGNVPRTLLRFLHTDDHIIDGWYRDHAEDAVLKCSAMMREGRRYNLLDDSPNSYYFLRPKKTDAGAIVRVLSSVYVPTPMLRRLLAEALQQRSDYERLEFYNSLSQHAPTRRTSAFIYESWFHNALSTRQSIQCQFIVRGTNDRMTIGNTYTISGTNAFAPPTLDTPMPQTPPYYWVAPYKNFPGIKSALILSGSAGVYAFYMTIGSDKESPMKGLQILRKRFPDLPMNVPWRVVFVGLEEDRVKRIAYRWANSGKMVFPDNTSVSILWSVVNPVDEDVVFKAYRDEDDPVPSDFDEELRVAGG